MAHLLLIPAEHRSHCHLEGGKERDTLKRARVKVRERESNREIWSDKE